MAILGKRGVTPEMIFECCDCHDTYSGSQVLASSVHLHIVKENKDEPIKSVFRCELCQEEHEEGGG